MLAIAWSLSRSNTAAANDWGIKQGDTVTAQLVSASIPIPKTEQSDNIVANESKGVTETQPEVKPVEKQTLTRSDPGKSETAEAGRKTGAADACDAASAAVPTPGDCSALR